MNHWLQGGRVTLTAPFQRNGSPLDPTAVTFRVRKPDGTLAEFTTDDQHVANPEVGTWTCTSTSIAPGVTAAAWRDRER